MLRVIKLSYNSGPVMIHKGHHARCLIGIAAIAWTLASCASTQPVYFASQPTGATVFINATPMGRTNTTIEIARHTDTEILLELDGYRSERANLHPEWNGARWTKSFVLGTIFVPIVGGIIALADINTPYFYDLTPNSVSRVLQPSTPASDNPRNPLATE